MLDIKRLYEKRFETSERIRKDKLWKILCKVFLQQFVKDNDSVVDIGAGSCEFINNIRCQTKIAIDINDDVKKAANKDVKVIISSVKQIRNVLSKESVDVIFMSNLLEHLDNKEEVFRLLNESYDVLKKGGRLLIMQPDIALVGHKYWDFFDHKVPLTLASLTEALIANDFSISFVMHPFLPYTTKVKRIPLWPVLLRFYIHFRPLHFIFGKQFFICAEK